MAIRSFDRLNQKKDKDKRKENIIFNLLNTFKIDIIFASFCILLISGYNYYLSLQQVPSYDASYYLLNARDWLTNKPLDEHYRPPLISWIIVGVWSIAGEDWVIVKWIQPIFTIGTGIILYILLRKYKGGFFAFGVTALTMTQESLFLARDIFNQKVWHYSFLVLTIYLLKIQKKKYWFLAGVTGALTFASRYPIFLQAAVVFMVETIIIRKPKLAFRAILGAVPILVAIVSVVYLKAGIFQMALGKDSTVTTSLSPFYLLNSFEIWGVAFLLVPIALLQKRTYTDNFNYTFIAWFLVSLLFWSSSSENHQYRFTIQFTPAVYFLSVLAVENIVKSKISLNSLTSSLREIHIKGITKSVGSVVLLSSFFSASILLVLLFASFITYQSYFEKLLPPMQQETESQEIQKSSNIRNRFITYSVKITSPAQGESFMVNHNDSLPIIGTSSLPSPTSEVP